MKLAIVKFNPDRFVWSRYGVKSISITIPRVWFKSYYDYARTCIRYQLKDGELVFALKNPYGEGRYCILPFFKFIDGTIPKNALKWKYGYRQYYRLKSTELLELNGEPFKGL